MDRKTMWSTTRGKIRRVVARATTFKAPIGCLQIQCARTDIRLDEGNANATG